jgi:DNA relaxase NicK
MLIKPNETTFKGRVTRVDMAADGFGGEVTIQVTDVSEGDASQDFVGASPGATLRLFAAEPRAVKQGELYSVTASMMGDARGQRMVMRSARKLAAR